MTRSGRCQRVVRWIHLLLVLACAALPLRAQSLALADPRLGIHRMTLWAEARERYEAALLTADPAKRANLPSDELVQAGRSLSSLRRLALRLEGQWNETSNWGSCLDLMAMPGYADSAAEAPVIALRVWCPSEPTQALDPLRVEAFWSTPAGQRQRVRSEAVARSAFEAPGFDLFFRVPDLTPGRHTIEVELDFGTGGERARSLPIPFEVVVRLAQRCEALAAAQVQSYPALRLELEGLRTCGLRPAHGLPIETLLSAAEAEARFFADRAEALQVPGSDATSAPPQTPGASAAEALEPQVPSDPLYDPAAGPVGWFRPGFAPNALAYRPEQPSGWALLLGDDTRASAGRLRGPLGADWLSWAEDQGLVLVCLERAERSVLAAWPSVPAPLVIAPGKAAIAPQWSLSGAHDRKDWRFVLDVRGDRPPPTYLPGVLLLGSKAHSALVGAQSESGPYRLGQTLVLLAPSTELLTELQLPTLLADWPKVRRAGETGTADSSEHGAVPAEDPSELPAPGPAPAPKPGDQPQNEADPERSGS
jgi:hypothetical protein